MIVDLKPVKMKAYRERRKMSRQDLAIASRVSAPTIGKVESGRYIPYDAELQRIAKALGVEDPAELMKPLDAEEVEVG